MKNKIIALICGMMLLSGMTGVLAYDADTPYTVSMRFIVGADTSFTVSLAGIETEIEFEPATKDSKEVEPNSQVDGTPIVEVTNTGNVDLTFTHKVNDTMPTFVAVSYDSSYAPNWAKTITHAYSTIATSVSADTSVNVYMWANFTDADEGTAQRTYQINSTAS